MRKCRVFRRWQLLRFVKISVCLSVSSLTFCVPLDCACTCVPVDFSCAVRVCELRLSVCQCMYVCVCKCVYVRVRVFLSWFRQVLTAELQAPCVSVYVRAESRSVSVCAPSLSVCMPVP